MYKYNELIHSILFWYWKNIYNDKKVQKLNDIWDWSANILIPNLNIKKWNNSQTINESFLISDYSSIIFRNVVMKQKRVKAGIWFRCTLGTYIEKLNQIYFYQT